MKITPLRILAIGWLLGSNGLSADQAQFHYQESAAVLEITRGETPVLTYHKAEVAPPEGAAEAFRRSGFIHPLHTPKGAVVTSIHAPDHIHHMGLWHAWVHTEFRGRELDFWNLKAEQGTVRFAGSQRVTRLADSVGFTVRQEQVQLPREAGAKEEVVLAENFTVQAKQVDGANVIDYVIEQTNVTDAPLGLPAYRYGGGIAFRAPESWDEETSSYLTSEGLDRKAGHATRGRWCAMYGPTEYGGATVVIMGHPSNHDAPQRMRLWPEGKVFFNFVPAQASDWQIDPGQKIELKYRVLIFDGHVAATEIEQRWSAYKNEIHD